MGAWGSCFIFVCLPIIVAAAASDPMKCTEVFVNNFEYGSGNNLIMSANFKLFYVENETNIIQVSDVIAWDYNQKKSAAQICADISSNCISDFSKPLNISVVDDYFELRVDFGKDNGMPEEGLIFWYSYAEEGNINHPDGTLFSPEKACIVNSFDGNRIYQCCNTFAPVAKAPSQFSGDYRKCKVFKSQVSILNANDNSINASSTLTIEIMDDNSIHTTDFSATKGISFTYELNECGGIETNEETCYLPSADYKAIVSVFIEPPGTIEPTIGKWIIRDNLMLSSEGVPLTEQNNCKYYNQPLDNDHVLSSQFCCQQFV